LIPWLIENGPSFDAVIANGIWQFSQFRHAAAMRRLGKPYVVFTHGMLDPWFKKTYPLKHLKKLLYWPWGEYRVLRDAAAVLFTCERSGSWLASHSAFIKPRSWSLTMEPLVQWVIPTPNARSFWPRFPT